MSRWKMRSRSHILIGAGLAIACVSLAASVGPLTEIPWGITDPQLRERIGREPMQAGPQSSTYQFDGERREYFFTNGKLTGVKQRFDSSHSEHNGYITDYRDQAAAFAKAFGAPKIDFADWRDDSLQEERLGYLKQDRAHASDILASDLFAGEGIAAGHLVLLTVYCSAETEVMHELSSENGKIVHEVEYVRLNGDACPLGGPLP